MYTPQEVSEKTFPKSSGLSSGYSMTAVDEFLDGLTEDYTALYKDNTTLKAKLKVLAEKVEEYRATEDAMRSTLLAAQKMAAQMVATVAREAVSISVATTTIGRCSTCAISAIFMRSMEAMEEGINATAPMVRTFTSTCPVVRWSMMPRLESMSVM